MIFKQLLPSERLKPYVNCYWFMDSQGEVEVNDRLFPSGFTEIVFNLGNATWESSVGDAFHPNPKMELLGQRTQSTVIKSKGNNRMIGVRFYPHTAGLFIREKMPELTNHVGDLTDIFGSEATALFQRLGEEPALDTRIGFIDRFLTGKLERNSGKRIDQMKILHHVLLRMQSNTHIDSIAAQCGISSRYLQKLFRVYVGIPPKMYVKINRFQRSFRYLNQAPGRLTSVAYECGYFDQSHFIRDFKSFTGITPSAYTPELFPINRLFS